MGMGNSQLTLCSPFVWAGVARYVSMSIVPSFIIRGSVRRAISLFRHEAVITNIALWPLHIRGVFYV